ncbi:MAG: hypothetical protein JO077_01160 [Verrucomicrobia bacterium]|nr:hypothetical protein [Verrucomicrobiota bacterium]
MMMTIEELTEVIQKLLLAGFKANNGTLLFWTPAVGLARRTPALAPLESRNLKAPDGD